MLACSPRLCLSQKFGIAGGKRLPPPIRQARIAPQCVAGAPRTGKRPWPPIRLSFLLNRTSATKREFRRFRVSGGVVFFFLFFFFCFFFFFVVVVFLLCFVFC